MFSRRPVHYDLTIRTDLKDLTFTGTARADNLWVIAKRINARLRAGNDTITARVRTRTGTRVDGGKGRDTVQLRHQRGAQLVKFKAKLISIEIRR